MEAYAAIAMAMQESVDEPGEEKDEMSEPEMALDESG
jgi:hypothetical protein